VCGSPVYTFLTLDVIEAMCSCLIAEAEDGEQCRRSDGDQELRIISEFSRCLTQVVDSASRTRGKQRSPVACSLQISHSSCNLIYIYIYHVGLLAEVI